MDLWPSVSSNIKLYSVPPSVIYKPCKRTHPPTPIHFAPAQEGLINNYFASGRHHAKGGGGLTGNPQRIEWIGLNIAIGTGEVSVTSSLSLYSRFLPVCLSRTFSHSVCVPHSLLPAASLLRTLGTLASNLSGRVYWFSSVPPYNNRW
jgi:hypothetical protein